MKKLLALFLTVALLATLAVSVALTVGAEGEGYYLATSVPQVGDKIVIAFKNGEDFYAFPNANKSSSASIAATKITVENGLATVDSTVTFEIIENSGNIGIKSTAAANYIGFNSNKVSCNGWGDTKYAAITAAEANGTFIVGSSNNSPRGLTYSGTNFTVSNDGGAPVYIFVYGAKPEESSESDESSKAESSEEPSSEEPSSEEPSSEEPSSEPDESSESESEKGYYLATEIPAVGDKIVIAFKNGEDFYAFPNANKGSGTSIAATKITVENGLATVDSTVTFEIIENSDNVGIKSTAAANYIGFNSNKIACNGWGDTKYAVITAAEANGTFIVGSPNNAPRGLTYSGTNFTVSNDGGAPVYIFVYGDKPEEEEGVVVSLGSKVNEKTFSLRLGAKYNGKLLSADERASVQDLGIVFYPSKFLKAADALDLTTEGAAILSATGIDEDYYVDGQKFVDYETFVFYANIVDIPENGRNTDISFRPYIIYSEGTVYGEVLARNYNDTREAASRLAENQGENEITCPDNWFN